MPNPESDKEPILIIKLDAKLLRHLGNASYRNHKKKFYNSFGQTEKNSIREHVSTSAVTVVLAFFVKFYD